MGTTKKDIITYALKPLAWTYGVVTAVRNKLFDWKILPQESFNVPVVCVGNITVGGTGKTPHVEYLVRTLSPSYKMAVLSRGYKRKTKGFVLANSHSTPQTIGDEAYQLYRKHGADVKVAVCRKRSQGIKELLRLFPDLELIVLDDAYQHRYVRPKVAMMLTDYQHPYFKDSLLPLGRLRESRFGANRADVVVMTKCPDSLQPIDFRVNTRDMFLMAFQKVFFSTYDYGLPEPVFPEDNPYDVNLRSLSGRDSALVVTGIANPRGFIRHFHDYDFRIKIAHFPDHHDFTRSEIKQLQKTFNEMKGERKIIVTTEKDAVRLLNNPYYPEELKPLTFYIPISVRMLNGVSEDAFISQISKLIDAPSD